MEFDFKANETIDTLDNVPEQFRPVYEPAADGKFSISATMRGIVDAITGLNGALKNERKTSAALKSQKDITSVLRAAVGVDTVEEVKTRIDELSQQVAEKSKVDPAKIKADIEKAFNSEREGLKNENAQMQSTLERYLIDSAAVTALAEAKGNVKLLLPIIKQLAAVVKDGDEYVVRVKDSAGDYRGDGKGGFMTVADLVKELKSSSDYGVAFQSDAPSGGGKPNAQSTSFGPRASSPSPTRNREERSPQQLISDGLARRRSRG